MSATLKRSKKRNRGRWITIYEKRRGNVALGCGCQRSSWTWSVIQRFSCNSKVRGRRRGGLLQKGGGQVACCEYVRKEGAVLHRDGRAVGKNWLYFRSNTQHRNLMRSKFEQNRTWPTSNTHGLLFEPNPWPGNLHPLRSPAHPLLNFPLPFKLAVPSNLRAPQLLTLGPCPLPPSPK